MAGVTVVYVSCCCVWHLLTSVQNVSLPMSLAPSSIMDVQDVEPMPAQPNIQWAELVFPQTMLLPSAYANESTDLPTPTPTPAGTQPPLYVREYAPSPDVQQEPVMSRKRRATSPQFKVATRRRRLNNGMPRREAAVGTSDRTPANFTSSIAPSPSNARATAAHTDHAQMVASTSRLPPQSPVTLSALLPRTPPPPHLDDEDYLDLATLTTYGSAQPGADGHETLPAAMDVDPPEVAVPSRGSAGLGPALASTSTLDVPLRHQTVAEPLARQFHIQTPLQQHDVLYRRQAALPQRPPPDPPIAGPYMVRDVPPRQDLPREDGWRSTTGAPPVAPHARGYPRAAQRTPLQIIPEDRTARQLQDALSQDQENIPPPYALATRAQHPRGTHDQRAPLLDLRSLETNTVVSATERTHPRGTSHEPPRGTRSLDESIHAPTAAARGSVPRNPVATPARQSMQEPRGGYPLVRFNDHHGHIRGTDPAHIAEIRADAPTSVLVVRFPGVTALPPGRMVTNINQRMSATCREEFGEPNVWLVPPRPDPLAAPGDYEPRAWFLLGHSPQLGEELLRRFCISTHILTFFVFPLDIEPDLVLTLGGFASNIGFQIESMIRATFESVAIRNILAQQIAMNPRYDGMSDDSGVEYVLESVDIEVITVDQTYAANIFLSSPASTPENFRIMRDAIASIPFINSFNAPAEPLWFECELCASHDHPTQACRYPTLPGWLGPVLPSEPRPPQPQFGPGSALTYRPSRPSQGTNSGGGRGGRGRSRGGSSHLMNQGMSYGGRSGGAAGGMAGSSGRGRSF